MGKWKRKWKSADTERMAALESWAKASSLLDDARKENAALIAQVSALAHARDFWYQRHEDLAHRLRALADPDDLKKLDPDGALRELAGTLAADGTSVGPEVVREDGPSIGCALAQECDEGKRMRQELEEKERQIATLRDVARPDEESVCSACLVSCEETERLRHDLKQSRAEIRFLQAANKEEAGRASSRRGTIQVTRAVLCRMQDYARKRLTFDATEAQTVKAMLEEALATIDGAAPPQEEAPADGSTCAVTNEKPALAHELEMANADVASLSERLRQERETSDRLRDILARARAMVDGPDWTGVRGILAEEVEPYSPT